MISASAMGIIFPNIHDENLPEMLNARTMASLPFAGRYRLIDFTLSGMSRAGIQNVGVVTNQNYRSLMDHLGNGREWDLSRKRGGLALFPPYATASGAHMYSGRVEALAGIMDWLSHQRESLVVLSDCNIAFNLDYKELLRTHRESGADVTMVYTRGEIPPGMQKDNVVLELAEDGRVADMRINDYKKGPVNLSMSLFVVGREYLINLVREAMVRGYKRLEEDVLLPGLSVIKVMGYEFEGYHARIYDMQSYYRESMRLLDPANLAGLFPPGRPVYTKVRDEAPVRYAIDAAVKGCLVADGCIVEGEIENCILFRGVRVGKGAKLKNCILMQGTEVAPGAEMAYVVTDKDVEVGGDQRLRGASGFPMFIAKGSKVL